MRPHVETALIFLLAAGHGACGTRPHPAAPPAASPAALPIVIPTKPAAPALLSSLKEVKGKVLKSACWEDKQGSSCLVVWGKNNELAPDMECDSELRAARFRKQGNQYRVAWQIRDFSKDCQSVQLADSLRIVDIDGDGAAETGLFYEIVGDGGDPYDLKFMLHHQDRKYAIRGKIPRDDAARYEKTPDTSLHSLPAPIRNYAESQWDAMVAPMLAELADEVRPAPGPSSTPGNPPLRKETGKP